MRSLAHVYSFQSLRVPWTTLGTVDEIPMKRLCVRVSAPLWNVHRQAIEAIGDMPIAACRCWRSKADVPNPARWATWSMNCCRDAGPGEDLWKSRSWSPQEANQPRPRGGAAQPDQTNPGRASLREVRPRAPTQGVGQRREVRVAGPKLWAAPGRRRPRHPHRRLPAGGRHPVQRTPPPPRHAGCASDHHRLVHRSRPGMAVRTHRRMAAARGRT